MKSDIKSPAAYPVLSFVLCIAVTAVLVCMAYEPGVVDPEYEHAAYLLFAFFCAALLAFPSNLTAVFIIRAYLFFKRRRAGIGIRN